MSQSISLPYYPASNRTPGVFADVDGSRANTATEQQRALLLGQMLSAGTATANTPYLITSVIQAGQLFGVGSMLYQMVEQYLSQDTFGSSGPSAWPTQPARRRPARSR